MTGFESSLASTLTKGVALSIREMHLKDATRLDQAYLRVGTGAFVRYTRGFEWSGGSSFHVYESFTVPGGSVFSIERVRINIPGEYGYQTIQTPAYIWCAKVERGEVPNPDLYGLVDFYVQKEDPHVSWVGAII